MKASTTVLLLAFSLACQAQDEGPQVLTRKALLQLVADNHPMARQAALRTAMGEATVRSARGAFDPVVGSSYKEKTFDGKDYYSLLDAGLKVPTWFGAELFGGFGQNNGEFLNPENVLPDAGQLKAGISMQVGQGLLMDRRRADLRRAQAFEEMAEAERQRLLNDLFHEVLGDHVEWIASYLQVQVAREAVAQAEIRLQAVRGSFRGGDRPAIDTLEALLQVQDRTMRLQDAELGFQVAGLKLSEHLWDEFLRPLQIGPGLIPDTTEIVAPELTTPLDSLFQQAQQLHPDLLERQGRISQLEVDRRLRAEMLKPRLDLEYAFLAGGGVITGDGTTTWRQGDRALGVGFSMPLLLRRERGELSLASLRLADAELGLERQRLRIRNTVDRRYQELSTLAAQVDLGSRMVNNYRGLLNGEYTRFQAGESSLFLVNQREVALLDSRLKQVELEGKLRKAHFTLDRDAGALWRIVSEIITQRDR